MNSLWCVKGIVALFAFWMTVGSARTRALEITVDRVLQLEQQVDDLTRRLQLLEAQCNTVAVVAAATGESEQLGSVTILNANQIPRENCKKILAEDSSARSGLYRIALTDQREFTVYCDMETDGGGWTVIQRRVDNTTDFYRNCREYKDGFGNLETNFWLGLERIHLLTHSAHRQLLVKMSDHSDEEAVSKYSHFSVANEVSGYKLHVQGYLQDKSNGGDALTDIHHERKFSAHDCDQDSSAEKNCAKMYHGGWWYDKCFESNLNGRYYSNGVNDGIIWYTFTGYSYSAKSVSMAIR